MSTTAIATIILVGVFLTLVFLRVPIVFAIGIASLIDFFYLASIRCRWRLSLSAI